jgi:hypothetical protein
MRSAEMHRQRRCLLEVDRTGEGTVQEGKRAPQRGSLQVERPCDAGSLQTHTSDGQGGRFAISDEQGHDDLSPDGSLPPPLGPRSGESSSGLPTRRSTNVPVAVACQIFLSGSVRSLTLMTSPTQPND